MMEDRKHNVLPAAPFAHEIEALRAAAGHLLKARGEDGMPDLAAAIQRNGLVWALLIEETAAPDSAMPRHLRDMIQERGVEAINLGQKLLFDKDGALVDTLADIGLRTARELKTS